MLVKQHIDRQKRCKNDLASTVCVFTSDNSRSINTLEKKCTHLQKTIDRDCDLIINFEFMDCLLVVLFHVQIRASSGCKTLDELTVMKQRQKINLLYTIEIFYEILTIITKDKSVIDAMFPNKVNKQKLSSVPSEFGTIQTAGKSI